MDENGDAEGNYTLIARKTYNDDEEFGLFPVGVFALKRTDSKLPVCIKFLFRYSVEHCLKLEQFSFGISP